MNFFAILNHWFHLISVVIWIGGVAFQVFIITPFLKRGDPSEVFLKNISDRFRRWAGPLLGILAVTGGINFGVRSKGYEFIPPGYISALGLKVFLVAAVASLYFFDLIRVRHEEPGPPKRDEGAPLLPGFAYTRLTLIIGVVIIFLASMLRQWKF